MFNDDDRDFLKGGLVKTTLAGASIPSGQGLPVQTNPQVASAFAASLATAFGASTSGVLRSSGPGTVYSMYGVNVSGAAIQYLQIHNTGVVIASGAVPLRSFKVGAAGTDVSIGQDQLTPLGENCSLGVVYAWSTNPRTFVPADGNNYNLEVRLK